MPQIMVDHQGLEIMSSMLVEVMDATSAWEPPEESEEESARKDKGKEVATPSIILYTPDSSSRDSIVEEEESELNWTQYEPPAGLSSVQGVDSKIITQIVQPSIERIKLKIAAEEQQRKEHEEAERLRQDNEAKSENDTNDEEPTIDESEEGKDEKRSPIPKYHRVEPATFAGVQIIIDENGLLRPAPAVPPKSKKRNIFGRLRRLYGSETAESSAQGAVRNHKKSSSAGGSLEMLSKSAFDITKKGITNSSTGTSLHDQIECVSCLEDFTSKDMVRVTCHSYCMECFERLIRTACESEQQWPPKCCLNDIPASTIQSGLCMYPDLQRTYKEKCEERSIAVGDRVYCSARLCGLFIRPEQINRALDLGRCSKGHWICILCRGPQHENEACPQDRDLQRTEELAVEEGWKRCHQCHAFVEHREACQHMTCRCGAEFCYVCGARWRTCGCTMEQLYNMKQQADIRRQAREARQAEEEAEVAEALRLVEEFEREEERKATLLRLERERRERERREKELRERLQREGERQNAVETKFQGLRDELASLHERQRVEIVREHGREENLLHYNAETLMTALRQQNNWDREVLRTNNSNKLANFKGLLDAEYIARVKEEQNVEEEYQQQLSAYWAGKEDGDVQIEAALLSLKRRMDKGCRAWSKWMRKELEIHHFLINEEQSIQLELMDETERRLAHESAQQTQAFKSRKAAELEWVDVVIEERESMLSDMREDEIKDGDDIDALLAEIGLNEDGQQTLRVSASSETI